VIAVLTIVALTAADAKAVGVKAATLIDAGAAAVAETVAAATLVVVSSG
jgi:hypothetical protein